MVETKARKGLASDQQLRQSKFFVFFFQGWAHNKAVSADPVDIEDALKAGHCVEFESGMQSCAKAICRVDGRNMRSDADFMISQLVQTLPQSCDPNESFFPAQ